MIPNYMPFVKKRNKNLKDFLMISIDIQFFLTMTNLLVVMTKILVIFNVSSIKSIIIN